MDRTRATPALIAERYRLESGARELSPGVWVAHDTALPRDVAIVEVPEVPDLGEAARASWCEQVLQGMHGADRFRHPNAVSTLGTGTLDGSPVVVTDLPDGPTLEEVVERDGALAPHRVSDLGLELASVLAAAHAAGLIHGAVAPTTVVLGPGGARLRHFGVAGALDDLAAVGPGTALAGTAPFAAPDRPPGGSAAADMWSLGVLLRYALEGRVPDLAAPAPPIAGALGDAVERLLSPHAVDRPSAVEARDDLAAAPPEPGGAEHPRRRRRRRGHEPAPDPRPATDRTTQPSTGRAAEPPEVDHVLTWGPDEPTAPPAPSPAGTGVAVSGHAGTRSGDGSAANGGGPAPAITRRTVPRVGSPVVVSRELAEELRGQGVALALTPVPPDLEETPGAEAAAGDEEEDAGPFRSTFSWPPPRRYRIGGSLLIFVIAVVLVTLLITNGRVGRTTAEEEAQEDRSAQVQDTAVVPDGWVTYRDPDPGFGIAHPPDWTVDEEGPVTRFRDPDSGAYLEVDYTTPPGPQQPVETLRALEPSFEATTTDYERLQIQATVFRTWNAALWEYTFTENDTPYHAVNLGLVTGDYRFALYFETPQAEWDRLLPVFYKFAQAFGPPS